jgi:hypothetical protein
MLGYARRRHGGWVYELEAPLIDGFFESAQVRPLRRPIALLVDKVLIEKVRKLLFSTLQARSFSRLLRKGLDPRSSVEESGRIAVEVGEYAANSCIDFPEIEVSIDEADPTDRLARILEDFTLRKRCNR